MRRLLALALLAAAVTADFQEDLARFRAAYASVTPAAQRKQAILALGRSEDPRAAAYLLDLWVDLDRASVRRRRALFKLRVKHRLLLDRIARDPGQSKSLRAQADEVDKQARAADAALAAPELDQAAILDALRAIKAPAAVAWLGQAGLDRARAPALLQAVAAAVAASGDAGFASLLTALERRKQAAAIVPLLHAIEARGMDPGPGLATLLKLLGHRDWTVRVAAARALASSGRPESIPALIRTMGREAEGGRARAEMNHALARLTGKNLGPFPDLWTAWWRAHEEDVMRGKLELGGHRPEPPRKLDQGRFYGIPQEARRIIYVLDVSGSMEISMRNPRWIKNAWVPARDDEESRLDAAKKELLRAVRKLRKGTRYAVLLYSDHVVALDDHLVKATREAADRLAAELERVGPESSTNIYEALDYALRMANVHPDSPPGAAKADAIFLISDGSPTDSEGQVEDPARVLSAVGKWNALQRVAISTIGIGRQHNAAFLKALAKQNGGEYYAAGSKRKREKRGR